MAASALTTNACPRLRHDASRLTSAEMLALLDPPGTTRKGTIRALIIRHIPKMDAASGLTPALV